MHTSLQWLNYLELHSDIKNKIKKIYPEIIPEWGRIDGITAVNQAKVLEAFREKRVAEEDFHESTGYGYDDGGRDKLEDIYARVFGGEKALVRPHFISGTHTLTVTLFGLLRPGDKILSVTGPPYDTLQRVIGNNTDISTKGTGTLSDWGIKYDDLPMHANGYPDLTHLKEKLTPDVKVAFIQRSLGYNGKRSALTVGDLDNIIKAVRNHMPGVIIMVDNCYGEFAETQEPLESGADLIAGSLIKNPGGALATSGGYVAGKETLVDKVAARLSAPGLGGHLGAINSKRHLYMGLFYAPTLVGNSLKAAVFAARLFKIMGYDTKPAFNHERGDIVQAITLGDPEKVKVFCRSIQNYSPVGSYLTPEPSPVPGYGDPVIMAAGTFIQGASGELSADAPMREPYTVFLQGGFTLSHALIAICKAADNILRHTV